MRRAEWAGNGLAAVLPCLVLACVVFARAQSSQPLPSSAPSVYPGSGVNTGHSTDYDFPGVDPNFAHRQMVARREEAYRRMQDNTMKLVILTRELQQSVHEHGPEAADAKRLDDIAKLAHAVRDQMRQ